MKIWKDKDPALNSPIWKADFTCNKKRHRLQAHTKTELEELITKIRSDAKRIEFGLASDTKRITLAELAAEHIRDFDYRVEYYRRGKVVIEMFINFIGRDTFVDEIATADFRNFVRHRKTQNPKLKKASINKDLAYISKMLSTASHYFRELGDYNPPKFPWATGSSRPRQRVIYREESEKLLAYLRDPALHKGEKPESPQIRGDYADMYEVAINTTMRWGEVAQLEWGMVNLDAAEIVLPARITKTDETRVVPLNSRVREILARRSETAWSHWVFPRKDGKDYRKYYYDRLRSIAKKLGLAFGGESGFTLHSTRHTAITEMLHNGVDIATVQQISGHRDRTIALRYAHTNKARVHDAIEMLTFSKKHR